MHVDSSAARSSLLQGDLSCRALSFPVLPIGPLKINVNRNVYSDHGSDFYAVSGSQFTLDQGDLTGLEICQQSESIENHGVIGNMRSAATVSLDGTIDFFCFPHFDSPTVFAGLLDSERGGFFSIQPQLENVRFKQLYLPDTNVLLTRYLSHDAIV